MSLDAKQIDTQLTSSFHSEASISASCQGLLDTQIPKSSSQWYTTLVKELDTIQALAKEWEDDESRLLKQSVLPAISDCGQQFIQKRSTIENLLSTQESDISAQKEALVKAFNQLAQSVQKINTSVSSYEKSLKDWGKRLSKAHDQMNKTVAKVQSDAGHLVGDIQATNKAMAEMMEQIKKDKKIIAKAKSEKNNVVKTIFGIILGATGGIGGILAGMGVSSIAEGEGKIQAMEKTIKKYQQQMQAYQHNMVEEERQLVSLKALTLPAQSVLQDVEATEQSLDDVRISWESFSQELEGISGKISKAKEASMLIVQKAWFSAACDEWEKIEKSVC